MPQVLATDPNMYWTQKINLSKEPLNNYCVQCLRSIWSVGSGHSKWFERNSNCGSFHMKDRLLQARYAIHHLTTLLSSYFSWCRPSVLIKEPDSRWETSLWGEITSLGSTVFNVALYLKSCVKKTEWSTSE